MKTLLAMFILLTGAALLVPFGAANAQATPSVTGKWHFVLATDGGDRIIEPVFHQEDDQVTGKWNKDDVKGTFADGKLSLEFQIISEEAGPGTLKIKGVLAEDALSGDWSFGDYAGSFKATRLKE